ncbi:hypothetical protein GCM10009834_10830 [Streptomonospora arabica]
MHAAARVRADAGGGETAPTGFAGPAAMVDPHREEAVGAVRSHAPHLREADGGDRPRPAAGRAVSFRGSAESA